MVITVSNQKGGVGKTTTSAALAAGFSMAGKKYTLSLHDALQIGRASCRRTFSTITI